MDNVEPHAPTLLRFADVWHRYRRAGPDVLQGITWDVASGKTVLLGPNGAGKTTLLSIGATAMRPSRGSSEVITAPAQGRHDMAFRRSAIGWMPQQVRAISGVTSREQVAYVAWLKGLRRREAWEQAGLLLSAVGLDGVAGDRSSELSGGQLRRLGLAQALVGSPGVLLLDEPTAGLDPAQRRTFRELVAGLPEQLTVVVSTHQVDDLVDIFAKVVVMDHGVIRWEGSVEDFLAMAPAGAARPAEEAYSSLFSI